MPFFGSLTFTRLVTEDCDCWGQYHSDNEIYIYGDARVSEDFSGPRFIVHEIAHVFDHISGLAPRNALAAIQGSDPTFPDRGGDTPANYGSAGSFAGWQQSPQITPSEEFADMFVGWTYNTWSDDAEGFGQARSDFMSANMALWVNQAMGR